MRIDCSTGGCLQDRSMFAAAGRELQLTLSTPAGSNLRLIDVPISNCIRSGINKVRSHVCQPSAPL